MTYKYRITTKTKACQNFLDGANVNCEEDRSADDMFDTTYELKRHGYKHGKDFIVKRT